ncbi:hypothetical protein ACJX0J_031489, partial [Zea mays]
MCSKKLYMYLIGTIQSILLGNLCYGKLYMFIFLKKIKKHIYKKIVTAAVRIIGEEFIMYSSFFLFFIYHYIYAQAADFLFLKAHIIRGLSKPNCSLLMTGNIISITAIIQMVTKILAYLEYFSVI